MREANDTDRRARPFSAILRADQYRDQPVPRGAVLGPVPQRVRAIVAGETLADSERVMLSRDRASPGLLLPAGGPPRRAARGVGPHRRAAQRAALPGRSASAAVASRTRSGPPGRSTRRRSSRLRLALWSSVDEWFVEDEQAFGHPRTRTRASTSIRRRATCASSRRRGARRQPAGQGPLRDVASAALTLPAEDVRTDSSNRAARRRPAHTRARRRTGTSASATPDRRLVWSYPEPQHDAERVRDLYCFFNERVDVGSTA
jgi:uncharacterized protein (DUF427 family)